VRRQHPPPPATYTIYTTYTRATFTAPAAERLGVPGRRRSFSEKEKIVFWYQDPKTSKYRAMYGDLSAKDIDAADVPRAAGKP
jgi:hypothetical protein